MDLVVIDGLLFEGENFEVLSFLLQNGYKEKIDLIYIDPPFSTNSDFIIDHERTSTVSMPRKGLLAYSDKLSKNQYLEFIRERVVLMYYLLSERGSFYFHIDSKIGHYIKIILDEIFGIENYVNDISRKKSNPKNFYRKAYGNQKDVLLFYVKNKDKYIWNNVTIPYNDKELVEKYNKVDSSGRRYTTVPIHAPGETSGLTGEM